MNDQAVTQVLPTLDDDTPLLEDLEPSRRADGGILTVVIIGSGPAGLSAAAQASALGIPYVLLEAEDHASDTIFKYQKGKHVMAEPAILPLRSGMEFAAGTREQVLEAWNQGINRIGINIRHGHRVNRVTRESRRRFVVGCENGEEFRTRHVVLAIGLQGNVRRLGVPGEQLSRVQYTLDDPDAYEGETIVVVGAGDAAIENALALARQNRVILINRSGEFARCKDANLSLILAAARDGVLEIRYSARSVRVEETPDGEAPLRYTVQRDGGAEEIPCHRVIGRLGASPPRQLLESFGLAFPNADANAVPILSTTYESNIGGLYVIGALGGYPLIKQAMNQGFEVISTLMEMGVVPADEELLLDRLAEFRPGYTVNEALSVIQHNVPLLRDLTTLQMRELVLESQILRPAPGDVIFRKNDYTNSFMAIIEGAVNVEIEDDTGVTGTVPLGAGQFFGEMGLISGRRRTATVIAGEECSILEVPRRLMLKLVASVEAVRKQIDTAFVRRAITTYLAPQLPPEMVDELMAGGVDVRRCEAGEVVFREGDAPDYLYLIRSGSVTVSRDVSGRDVVLSYVSAGNYVGEMALLNETPRSATVQATVPTEMLRLKAATFKDVIARNPAWREALEKKLLERIRSNVRREQQQSADSDIIRFLMGEGLGESTDVLLIDASRCIHCNNCETACAETHQGMSRLNRAAGPTLGNIHVPTSCRHCEHPHCMKDCPPDAIRRSENGEVYITDACIGCGNCERNCPYGVIQMRAPATEEKGSLMSWLLFGTGSGPGESVGSYDPSAPKKAVKCDMCKGQSGGPACVRACPTGAAIRVSPETFLNQATDAD
ncbi:MAG TPA: cyclic nucleotide-binding domain-containing protein [Moraxellaceae bacterium]|nr:cyclic nucleotide-binding domain-containing protein [Moraxellaceae bacterium]